MHRGPLTIWYVSLRLKSGYEISVHALDCHCFGMPMRMEIQRVIFSSAVIVNDHPYNLF